MLNSYCINLNQVNTILKRTIHNVRWLLLKNQDLNVRYCSSSSSTTSDETSKHLKKKHETNSTTTAANINHSHKFQTILNYLEKSIPLFINGSNAAQNNEELNEFERLIQNIKCTLQDNQDGSTKRILDNIEQKIIESEKNGSEEMFERFLRQRCLQNRTSTLLDGSISCLLYPDLDLWNKTLPQQFLLDFLVANILGVLDYLNQHPNQFNYSRIPALGHDYIQRYPSGKTPEEEAASKPETGNHICIGFGWNFYLIDLNQYENHYQTLWQVLKFFFDHKQARNNHYPMGILSTLPRNDCVYGGKFLNESDLTKLRQAKLLISLERVEPLPPPQAPPQQPPSSSTTSERDNRLSTMAKQVLLSNRDNIGHRWFDKSLQLIFVLNQKSDQLLAHGLCLEQTHANIQSILKLMDHSIQFLTKFKPIESKIHKDIQFKKLQLFDLKSKRLTEIINQATNQFAMEKYSNIRDRFELQMFQFGEYGLEQIEQHFQVQAEHWIQIAVNLALFQLTKQSRPCYQRYFSVDDPNKELWLQCFNQEMMDYVNDPNDQQKLLIALQSLKFHQQVLMPSKTRPSNSTHDTDEQSLEQNASASNIEANLLVYQNSLKSASSTTEVVGGTKNSEVAMLDSLFRSKSFKRLRRCTIQVTTLKPGDQYYDWHLVNNGQPYYDHRVNLVAHVAKSRIDFSLTVLKGLSQQNNSNHENWIRRFNAQAFGNELNNCLKLIKTVFES